MTNVAAGAPGAIHIVLQNEGGLGSRSSPCILPSISPIWGCRPRFSIPIRRRLPCRTILQSIAGGLREGRSAVASQRDVSSPAATAGACSQSFAGSSASASREPEHLRSALADDCRLSDDAPQALS